VILPPKKPVEYLYIVSSGAVDVMSANHARARKLAHLKAGESFGGSELTRGGKSIAWVRAGERPVEVLAYPRAEFLRMLDNRQSQIVNRKS
jgi:CRP-like cAMP-binding protein